VIAGGAVAAIELRGSIPPVATPDARVAVIQTIDAAVIAVATPPDAEIPDAPLPPPPDAALEVHRPRPHPPNTAITPPAVPPAETHEVTINSRPWSYFTIDEAPLQHQTLEVVRLTAGAHVIHFTRDKVHKDVAITVPANDRLAVVQDMSN